MRKLGAHLPCEPNTVTAWVAWARQDGVLVKVKDHAFRSAGESQAAEYLLGLHLWRTALPRLSELVRIPVRPQDLDWIKGEFEQAARP